MNTVKKDLFYEFDGFRVEVGQKCLWHGDELVPLTAKAFDTLLVLVENNGRLVEKDVLLNEVWADTFVEESTLAQNISTLRKAFAAQEHGTQFIETVPRRGYRFLRNVHRTESDNDLYLIETRTSTRVLAEKTEIHDTDPPSPLAPLALKYFRRNRALIVGSFICLVVLTGGYFAVSTWDNPERFTRFEINSIVSSGEISRITVSPDGKYIGVVETKNGLQSLKVRQTTNASAVELIPPSEDEYLGITFAPAGDSIYYAVYSKTLKAQPGLRTGVLYNVPILGGARTEILKDIDSTPAISPDGGRVAFIRQMPAERQSTIVIREINPGAGAERILASRPLKERFSPTSIAWAPNGKLIATVTVDGTDPEKPMVVSSVDIASGEINSLTPESWMWVGQIAWLPDSGGIFFPAYSGRSPNITDEIWLVTVAGGKTRQITNGINGVFGIGVTADSKSIVAVRSSRVSGLWVSAADGPGPAENINKAFGDNSLGALGMDWTPNGEIIYSSAANGNADIWIVNSDGSRVRQVTDDPHADFGPVVSPDNNVIFFLSNRSGPGGIWRMQKDGTGLTELAKMRDASSLSVSPDGAWVYLSAAESKTRTTVLWKLPASGGDPVQLTTKPCFFSQISPDGKFVACYYPMTDNDSRPWLVRPTILKADGSTVVRQFSELDWVKDVPIVWTRDSLGISFQQTVNGVSNIFVQKLDGGPAQRVTNFQTDEIFRYRWSRDGKTLAFEKGLKINDVIVIRDKEN